MRDPHYCYFCDNKRFTEKKTEKSARKKEKTKPLMASKRKSKNHAMLEKSQNHFVLLKKLAGLFVREDLWDLFRCYFLQQLFDASVLLH